MDTFVWTVTGLISEQLLAWVPMVSAVKGFHCTCTCLITKTSGIQCTCTHLSDSSHTHHIIKCIDPHLMLISWDAVANIPSGHHTADDIAPCALSLAYRYRNINVHVLYNHTCTCTCRQKFVSCTVHEYGNRRSINILIIIVESIIFY